MGTTLHPDVAKMFQKRQSGNSKGNGMASALTVRRRTITQTSDGLVCLDDIWIAAKSPKGKSPAKWRSGQPVRELQIALYEKLYGRTGNYEFARIIRQVRIPSEPSRTRSWRFRTPAFLVPNWRSRSKKFGFAMRKAIPRSRTKSSKNLLRKRTSGWEFVRYRVRRAKTIQRLFINTG